MFKKKVVSVQKKNNIQLSDKPVVEAGTKKKGFQLARTRYVVLQRFIFFTV